MKKLLAAYLVNPTDKACIKAYNYYNKHVMAACMLEDEYAEALMQIVAHYRRISK